MRRPFLGLYGLQIGKDIRGVGVRLSARPYLFDPTVFSDEIGGADDAHRGFAVERFLLPDVIVLYGLKLRI